MRSKSIRLADLAGQVDSLAEQVAQTVIRAIQLRESPPAAVFTCERDLWRWSWQLRHAIANPDHQGVPDSTPDVPRRVAVILLVDLDVKRDLAWLGQDVAAAVGRTGSGWQIRHTSVHPDPARILAGQDEPGTRHPAARTEAEGGRAR